jgi:hypothetical protein
VAEQAVVDRQIDLIADEDVWVAPCGVGEEVESKDYRAIARVLERHHAKGGFAGLNGCEDVFDACLWDNLVPWFWETLRRSLRYELAMYPVKVTLLLDQNPPLELRTC